MFVFGLRKGVPVVVSMPVTKAWHVAVWVDHIVL